MKFENTDIWGFKHAIRGMRNPLESWSKSDSGICKGGDDGIGCGNCSIENCEHEYDYSYQIGKNDLSLMQRLIFAGSDERKFMRQIFVSVDITAPLYWWKEMDTYKVGTVANSTSTMHKLATTPITLECFEMDDYMPEIKLSNGFKDNEFIGYKDVSNGWNIMINILETLRNTYLTTKDKKYWKELIRLLPESWLQTRTVTMNYENLRNMYFARRYHKLSEWHTFCDWLETLPYAKELIMLEKKGE